MTRAAFDWLVSAIFLVAGGFTVGYVAHKPAPRPACVTDADLAQMRAQAESAAHRCQMTESDVAELAARLALLGVRLHP